MSEQAQATQASEATESTESQAQEGAEATKAVKGGGKQTSPEFGESDLDRVLTIKVDGEVKKMTLREAQKYASLGNAAYKKMSEAAQLRKEAEAAIHMLKSNPREALSRLGIDPEEFAEMTLAEKIKVASMSDEQRKLAEYEARLKKYEEQEMQAEEEKKTQAEREEEARHAAEFDKEITEAFKKSGLPKKPFYVTQIAHVLNQAAVQGIDLQPDHAADIVRTRVESEIKDIAQALDIEKLRAILGKDLIRKILDVEVKSVAGKHQATESSPVAKAASKQSTQPYMSEKEWRRQFAR